MDVHEQHGDTDDSDGLTPILVGTAFKEGVMQPIRVLIVDDSEDMRLLCRHTLESSPSFVVCGEAANGEEAIALAASSHPDVIILDYLMPVMNGLTALSLLRPLYPSVPVIFLSASASAEVGQRALDLGAHAFFEKGHSFEQLKQVLLEVYAPAGAPR